MKTGIILLKLMFIVIGLILIAGAIIANLCNRKFFKTAEKTTAAITNIEVTKHRSNGETDYCHTVYVTYEADGVQYDNIRLGC